MRALNRPLAGSPGSALGWADSSRPLAWGRNYVMVRPDHFRVDYVINPYMDPADQPDPVRALAQWQELVRVIEEADLPPGLLNLVTGAGPEVGDEIVVNPGTDAVGFTGSAATGRRIAERAAGKAQLMELGGNGPVIILADADLEKAAAAGREGAVFLR